MNPRCGKYIITDAANREPTCDLLSACLPAPFGCESRFTGLAVADLVSR